MTDIDSSVEIGRRVEGSVQNNGHQPNNESSPKSPIKETNNLPARKPPKKLPTWIGFDETNDEHRQSPKRITTLPSSYATDGATVATTVDLAKICDGSVVFVQPNECSCECHELLTQNTDTERNDWI